MATSNLAADETHAALVRSRQARRLGAYDLERAIEALSAGGAPKPATVVNFTFSALWLEYEAERLDALAAGDPFIEGFERWLLGCLAMVRDFSDNKEKWA